jgi:cation diffusion facilitator CzcD-associated flavoprotein CzcO
MGQRPRSLKVAVIGAGLGGVACAVQLRRVGIDDVTVFERAAGPGGVWWHNSYPGCEVDVDSQVYSYSFMPWDWTRSHASRADLQRYVEAVIVEFGIGPWFRYNVSVTSAHWDDAAAAYRLETSDGEAGPFDLVVSCVGMLSDPSMPRWPGMDTFQGPVFHTAAFREDLDFAGRRVALVGTGSTACQLAPRLAEVAGHLDVYQREPGYVLPKKVRDFTEVERARYRRFPVLRRLARWRLLYEGNRAARAFRTADPAQRRITDFHRSYLERKVSDPDVRHALTPTHPYGCKRPVFTSEFYPTFNRPNVTLVPRAVTCLTQRGVLSTDGTERPADIVILATGFRAAEYLSTLEVIGPGGRTLHDTWGDEPWAFLGLTVPGFPNFFMLYGPNTNGGWSICGQLEKQARVVAEVARKMAKSGHRAVDTRPVLAGRYDRWIQSSIRRRRDSTGAACHNYFHSPTGKNVTQWPYSAYMYSIVLRALPPLGLQYSNGSSGSR